MDKDMRVMRPDAVLFVGDIVRIITLEEAERRYMTDGNSISFPEQSPYTLDIAKVDLNRFGGMMARIMKVDKICGHFHYEIQIVESGENTPGIWWCPSAFTVCEDDDEETAELAPPDPESMWYFLGVTDSVSLRGKI